MRETRGPDGHRRAPLRYAVALAVVMGVATSGAPVQAGTDGAGATTDPSVTTTAPSQPRTQAEARPRIATLATPLGQVSDGRLPEADRLASAISDELESEWLGPESRRAVTVRDALTGEHLVDANADTLVTPASTTKILAAAAIVTGLDPAHTFTTRVVAGDAPGEVVLVAGGDMLLARGRGDHEAVAGHAGVADLAAQTAASLEGVPLDGPVSVRLDLDHVAGPAALDTWSDVWVDAGYTGRIVQLGLEEDRALPDVPSPAEPEEEVAGAFREALADEGLEVAGLEEADAEDGADPAEQTPADGITEGATTDAASVTAPVPATELASVTSAPVRDVLALALATSDNAMVEQLARQAAVADGATTDQDAVTAWVVRAVAEDYGVDVTGVEIADTSGLSDGTRIPVGVVADLLVAGADGSHPHLQGVLAAGGLPIAGYTGTLSTRFHLPVHEEAIGTARAKTGSLPGVTSLAGTVVTRDGRLLVYAATADRIGEDGAVIEARSALDELVAQLARCGC
ncbi:D-alanyl-D-alanine carboxypeptidase/D-alanyl-D-alanine-endopeptidase [Ornithinimicrobium sp. LYQ103]|uniref:D-alanyl-D-alanine carboxypeptidase/D-alanyl-D-alanine-endopeptidase n=1 Tax=Ornithinimicrobium sp. LYQ103 TaxID=3378796 RepID=UPI003852A99B